MKFLNGDFQEEIYMEQLNDYILKNKDSLIYKLFKILYRIKQSPKI